MNMKLIVTAGLTLALLQGCASSFRAGGERAGVEGGAVLGTPAVIPGTYPDAVPSRLPPPSDGTGDVPPGR